MRSCPPSNPLTANALRERRGRWYVRAALAVYGVALIVALLAIYGCWGVA